MKILDIENMDKDEKELYQMLTSKFNETEMMKLMPLMVIDGEKYHREKLNENGVLGDVIGLFTHETIEKIRNSNSDAEVRKLIATKLNSL
jgi:hypothetical protein